MRSLLLSTVLIAIFSSTYSMLRDSDDAPVNTDMSFEHFDLSIYNFSVYNLTPSMPEGDFDALDNITKDTVYIVERAFNTIGSKLIEIQAKQGHEKDRFKMYYSIHQGFSELYDERNMPNYAEWHETIMKWDEFTQFKRVKECPENVFKMPDPYDPALEKKVKKRFHMSDTSVTPDREMPPTATMHYKGRPVVFDTGEACIKIERYSGKKLTETKYIMVTFTPGC